MTLSEEYREETFDKLVQARDTLGLAEKAYLIAEAQVLATLALAEATKEAAER